MSVVLTIVVCVAGVIVPGLLALLIIGNPLLSIALAGVAFLIELPCVYLVAVFWPQQRELKRRLTRTAEMLISGAMPEASADNAVTVFREQRSQSRLIERLERRFPLIDVRQALPRAVGLGVLGMLVVGVGAAWTGFGWTARLILLPVSGLGCGWAVLARQDAAQRKTFVAAFPEIADQVVRLTRSGVPVMEAIAIVAQEAPSPADSILADVSSAVAGGLDPETTMHSVAARVRIPVFSLFTSAVCLQMATGGSVSGALNNLSETLRARHTVALKAMSSAAQTRLTLVVLSALPIFVLAVQNFTNPQAIETLLHTESGGTLLRYGVSLIVVGLLVARSLSARVGR